MKFLVFSDSHGCDVRRLAELAEDCDGVIFAGDGERALSQFDGLKLYAVKGNCDYGSDLPEELTFHIGTVKLMLCHGHRYHVKTTTQLLSDRAAAEGCAAVIFGHTHEVCDRYEQGVYLINPGTAMHSFGILDVRANGILFSSAKISVTDM